MIAKGQKGQNSRFSSEVWLLQEGLGLLDLAGLAAERFELYSGHSGWNAIRPVFFRFCDLRTTITTSFSNIRIIHRNASFFKYNPTVKKGITQVISTKFCDGNIFWLQYFADRGSKWHYYLQCCSVGPRVPGTSCHTCTVRLNVRLLPVLQYLVFVW